MQRKDGLLIKTQDCKSEVKGYDPGSSAVFLGKSSQPIYIYIFKNCTLFWVILTYMGSNFQKC